MLLCLTMLACTSEKVGEAVKTLTLKQDVATEKANVSEHFSTVECVPLETAEDILIGVITKAVRHGDFIYVADANALYKFAPDGKFVAVLSKKGQGPDEYLNLSDFEVASDNEVWLLSRNARSIYLYTWDGEQKKKLQFEYWAAKMRMLSTDKMCVYIGNELNDSNQHQFKIIDLATGAIIRNDIEIDPIRAKFLHVNSANHFSPCLDGKYESFVYNIFDSYIYGIAKDSIVPVFQVDIYGKNIPESFYNEEYKDVSYFFQALFKGNYAYGAAFFAELRDKFLYSYFYGGQKHLALISKATNESTADFTLLLEDKLLSGFPVDLTETEMFVQDGSGLIIPLQPSDIMDFAKYHPESLDKIKEAIKFESDDQNPVLLFLNGD